MDAEQYLSFLEETTGYMDAITHIKNGLQGRGWSEEQASAAARELFAIAAMQQNQKGARRGR
ncbi:hypothetical protein J2X55_002278 [Microbacterium sp. 1154]|uniref:hypothetical protein n=1 Tax=Microbacterium sp. 1154 TaxID=2817733 RepID=UPI002861B195|nr:hypothetical protein [Microbacterium sp. 1154]MDR6691366.1 hypothetical protein [Microbacterium sp. 1154]